MQKRNPVKKEYFPYSIPKEWYCPLILQDMNQIINCTNCGKEIDFGSCYTSKQIHTDDGFGYPVCEDCYNQEEK